MCKISVITPVYKVEKYLEKCIDSILNQSFTDFELIIVDDGSPDSCGRIADEYCKKDKRVKAIHKENGGAPSARNAGIKEARGQYLYFPDSDDWLESSYLQELYTLAEKFKAQVVISGFKMEYFEQGIQKSYSVSSDEVIYNTQSDVRNNLHKYFDNMMMAVPWNKLYRTDYIKENEIYFPNLKWDDLHFNMEVIKNIDSVAISASNGYHFFRSRVGSETTTVFDGMLYSKRKEQFEHIMKIYTEWDKLKQPEIMNTLYGYYGSRLIQCIQEISISDCCNKRELISDILNDELAYTAIAKGNFSSKYIKLASIPVKTKSVRLSLLIGKIIGFVKLKFPNLFYRLKSQSVNKAVEN